MFDALMTKLKSSNYLTLETTPQHEPTLDAIIEKIKALDLASKVDGFSATDNPLAKLKYSSLFAALKLQMAFNKPVITTMTMRDRNKIALQSDLLGANDFDIRTILCLTGDPAKMSDQPNTKGVFESNSTLLLKMIKSFNHGMDLAGRPFKIQPKEIYPFAVTNSYAKSFKSLEKKMQKKIQEGALGLISQPIYDLENAKILLETFENAKSEVSSHKQDAQLIFGIFPIIKLRTALFLSAQVPGIHVPQYWIDALEKANQKSEEEERKVGLELNHKLFADIKKFHPKIHLMTANNFELANELISNG
jgi:5,10-methylenetetrahydrofolate reductase